MHLFLYGLLACSPDTPEAPIAAPDEPVVAQPAEPTPATEGPKGAMPAGKIGGEPILPNAVVVGGITEDAVHAGIATKMNEINRCWEDQWKTQQDLAGKVLVKFTIGQSGVVQNASVKSTSLRNEATETCVNKQITTARFAALERGSRAIVHYPFTFPPP